MTKRVPFSSPGRRVKPLVLCILVLAGLACSLLTPAGPEPSVSAKSAATPLGTAVTSAPPTPTPGQTPTAAAAPAYTGAFDCYGSEAGMGAYAGRLTLQPGGTVTFKDYDGIITSGTWSYDAVASRFTFSGAIAFANASYTPASDLLVASLAPNATAVHAEGGTVACQRAQPGITGPP